MGDPSVYTPVTKTAKAPVLAGVVGFFENPQSLMEATKKLREANYQSFDAFSPFPIHGLEKAQGLKRSALPFVTMGAGLTGFMCAVLLQGWTSVVSWPLNVGGKPYWSWPAFVPIFFELTVLFAGLATVAGMLIVNGLPNLNKRAFDNNITRDRFALMIDAPKLKTAEELGDMDDDEILKYRTRLAKFKAFEESEAKSFLTNLGAIDVKAVEQRGWFE
ncbi:MAG: DUF3341 domain-containing protein [Cryobacterium sp.]|nr:DUF3341 domain-containing protein [Oligoflexia bacterium]